MPPRKKTSATLPWPDDPDHRFVATFLKVLADERTAKGWTLEALSEKSGVDFGVISRGERLERIPGLVVLRRWVRALELEWTEVFVRAEKAIR
jgi:transcriptional regulator with XRE-family HTH domain